MAGANDFYDLVNKKLKEDEQPAQSGGAASFYALVNSKLKEEDEQAPETASASDYDPLALPPVYTPSAGRFGSPDALALPTQTKTSSLALPTPEEWANRIVGEVRAVNPWMPAPTTPTAQAQAAGTGKGTVAPGTAGGGGRGRKTEEELRKEQREAAAYARAVQPTSDMYLHPATAAAAEEQQKQADEARNTAEERAKQAEASKSEIEKQREKVKEAERLAAALQPTSDMYLHPVTAAAAEEQQKQADAAWERREEENRKLHEMGGRYGLAEDAQTVAENLGAGALSAVRGIGNALNYAGQEMTRGQLMEQQSVMSGLPGQQKIADSSGKLLEDMQQRGLQSIEQTADTLGLTGISKAGKWVQDFAQTAAEHSAASGKVARAFAQTANGVGGMVPSILSNIAVPGSGLWIMAAQAAGNATEEALKAGAKDEMAVIYGGAVAAVEVLTEKMFGGIPGLNIGSLDKGIENIVKRQIGSEAAQRAILFLADALGEGAEEFISEFADWGLNKWLVGDDARSFRQVHKDAWYSALIGALTSVAMSAPVEAIKAMGPKKLARQVAQEMGGRLEIEERTEKLKLPTPESLSQNENAAPNGTAEELALPTPGESAGNQNAARNGTAEGLEMQEADKNVSKADAKELIQKLKNSRNELEGEPTVATLTGTEFQKAGGKLTDQVGAFFKKLGNLVHRSGLGDVIIDTRGVKSDIAHGIGRAKAATFAAVPSVIEQGKQIDFQTNWKGRGYDSYVFAAPIDMAGKKRYVAAVVLSDQNNRFYLHEVIDEDGNLIYKIETPADIKTGVTAQDGVTGAAEVSTDTVPQSAQDVKTGLELPAVPVQEQAAERDLSLPAVPTQQAGGQAVEVRALPTPEEWANRNETDESWRREEMLEEEQARREAEEEEYRQARVEAAAEELPTDAANMSDGGYSLNGYAASPGLRKLGVKIAEPITSTIGGDVLLAQARKAQKAQRALDRAIRKLAPTKAERALAMGLADGTYTEGGAVLYGRDGVPIRDVNMNKVRELAEYYREKNLYKRDRIGEQRRMNRDRETARAEELLKDADSFRKMNALRLNLNTMKRNMLAWAGQKLGADINRHLFDPVERNSAERIRFVNNMLKRVSEFKLTRAESEMVQRVIEGTAIQDQVSKLTADERRRVNAAATSADFELTAAEYNLTKDERKIAHRYQEWLDTQARLETMDADKINAAAKAYSGAYSDFYTAINEFLVMHGYEPIGFIEGYAPHLQPDNVQSTLGRLLSAFGMDVEVSALPTEIAGRTESYKPGKQWNPYFQHRAGADAMVDAVAGYESYVNYMSNVLYHTDDIQKLRIFINTLRGMYATEENRERISQAKELQNSSAEDKETFLLLNHEIEDGSNLTPEEIDARFEKYVDDLYSAIENKSKHGDVASVVEDYTNKLAGKQTKLDRAVESFFGRKNINVGNALSRTFGMSAVVGNLSSALNQLSQLPAVQAELGNKYVLKAVSDIIRGEGTALDDASDFLTGKKGTDSLLAERSWKDSTGRQRMDKVTRAMSIPFEAVDTLASRIYVRAKYLREIESGASHEEAVKAADDFTEKIVGNRIQGSRPMVFESKNAVVKLFSTFQLEVANAWAHIRQDLPAEIKAIEQSEGKAAAVERTAAILLRYGISAFLMNRLTEALYGGTPAPFDLIGYILGGVAAGNGETINDYLIGLVRDLFGLGGDDDDKEERDFDAGAALKETGSLMVGDMPYVRNAASMLGYGDTNLPLPSVGKTAGSLWDLIRGSGSWEDLGKSALRDAATWLPGGNQAKKTVQGIQTAAKQGRYDKNGNLMYPVDMSGAVGAARAAKAALFGPSSLGATDAYYASGDRKLSEKQTTVYEKLVSLGEDREEVFDTIMRFRKVENLKDSDEDGREKRDILRDADLDDHSKARLYETLFNKEGGYEELAGLMDYGLTFDDCMDVLDKFNELKYTGEKAGIQASHFAEWVDKNFEPEAAERIKEQYRYWTNIPAEPSAYKRAMETGTDIETAAEAMEINAAAEGKKNANGETIDGTKKIEVVRGVDTLDISPEEKMALLGSMGYKLDGYQDVSGFMSLSDYADAMEIDAEAKGKKVNGETVSGSKKLEVMQGVNKMDLTPKQKTQLMEALGYKMDQPPIWETGYTGKDYEAYYYMSDSQRETFEQYCDWMDVGDYARYAESIGDFHNINGKDGKTVVSRKEQVIAYIDELPLLPDQKTALYVAAGYNPNLTDKGFADCPWWDRLALRTQYYPG